MSTPRATSTTSVEAVDSCFCNVQHFQCLCACAEAPSLVVHSHGSHVTSVQFTHDDLHLIALGAPGRQGFQQLSVGDAER